VQTGGPSSVQCLAKATGLSPELLRHGDQPLTQAHVDTLPTERRELLQAQVGRPVCGLAETIGLTALPANGYRPSVPFVSQQAACLVAGRLIATILGLSHQPGFVQYDTLIGPHSRVDEHRLASPTCFCRQRADIVQALRRSRATHLSSPRS
jgi:hypothetical protein